MADRSTVGPRGGYGGTGRGASEVLAPTPSRVQVPDMLARTDTVDTAPVSLAYNGPSAAIPPKPPALTQAPAGSTRGIRDLFTGATLRSIMGLPRALTKIALAKVKHPEGGAIAQVAPDKSDVYATYMETMTNIPGIARLFAPFSAFWRMPKKGQSVMILKPENVDGPGVPYMLCGDGGSPGDVPTWLDNSNAGIFLAETLHLEAGGAVIIKSSSGAGSTGNDGTTTAVIQLKTDGTISISGGIGTNIQVSANGGGNVIVNGGHLNVARVSDQVAGNAGPYPIANGVISGPGAANFKA